MDTVTAVLLADWLGKPLWLWISFLGIVATLLVIDLGVLHRRPHEIELKESLWLSGGYISLGLLFGLWISWYLGADSAIDYYTGFLVEKSLSLDNIFVISVIFSYFAIPREYQHRVLFWGILGVIVMRGAMIGAGAALLHQFDWVLYLFGAFLVYSGVRMLTMLDDTVQIEDNPVLRFLQRHLRITHQFHGTRFFVRCPNGQSGDKLAVHATPLFLALVLIEIADLIFAVDSVPAIFAITRDPYIVYTSNIFAILGLRSLYFALSALVYRFHYLKYALACVLIFIGGKIFATWVVGEIPSWVSLAGTLGLLTAGVVVSMVKTRGGETALRRSQA